MSVRSMTAYGQGESSGDGGQVNCEIRTLNSRFIEVNVRLPRHLINFEPELISCVKSALGRGKVDVFIDVAKTTSTLDLPALDHTVAAHYLGLLDEFKTLSTSHENKNWSAIREPSVYEFFKFEGVLSGKGPGSREALIASLRAPLFAAVNAALKQVISNRESEGTALKSALEELIADLANSRQAIESRVSDIRAWVHDTYVKRLAKVIEDLDRLGRDIVRPSDERIAIELALLTDKADIEEEVTRLKAHETEFKSCLLQGDGVGRKLDFLCQELHREVNTISSKLQHSEIAERTLDMKQAIERMRQQVQNVE